MLYQYICISLKEITSSLVTKVPSECLLDIEKLVEDIQNIEKKGVVIESDWCHLLKKIVTTAIRQQGFFQIDGLLDHLEKIAIVGLSRPINKPRLAFLLLDLERHGKLISGLEPKRASILQEHLALIRYCYYGLE